jgi:hypothetical protein
LEPRIGRGATRPQSDEVQQKLIRIAKTLQRPSSDPSSKKAAIKSLVRAYNSSPDLKTYVVDLHLSSVAAANAPTRYLPSVPFSFGKRVVAHVQLDGVYSVDPKKAMFAFFHLESLNMGREGSLSKKPHKRESEPVARLRDKKLRARQPEITFEDPYIVAALIALAQAQRWFQTEADKAAQPEAQPSSNTSALFTVRLSVQVHYHARPTPDYNWMLTGFKVRLLLVTEIHSQHLYMYEASISSAFLDQLKKPSQFSPADPVRISYYKLPLGDPDELVKRFPDVLGLSDEQTEMGTE